MSKKRINFVQGLITNSTRTNTFFKSRPLEHIEARRMARIQVEKEYAHIEVPRAYHGKSRKWERRRNKKYWRYLFTRNRRLWALYYEILDGSELNDGRK